MTSRRIYLKSSRQKSGAPRRAVHHFLGINWAHPVRRIGRVFGFSPRKYQRRYRTKWF